jgi:DNA polymerase-3 subunit alpha
VSLIIAEREANGPFADFFEFCNRVDVSVLNKKTIESLVKAGAFDSMGHPRQGLLAVFEQVVDRTLARRRKEAEGQFELFAIDDEGAFDDARIEIPDLEFEKAQRLAFEKEMLGLYVSDHPLMGAEAALRRKTDRTIAELLDAAVEGPPLTIGGVVSSLQRKWTKKGDLMAVFVLEDLEAALEVMVFPKTMTDHGQKLADDAIVCVRGRVDTRDDLPKFIAMEIERFEPAAGSDQLEIVLPPTRVTDTLVDDLKKVLADHPGDARVFLQVGAKRLRLPNDFRVDTGNGLVGELRVLLGADAVRV